ncbi:MAG: DnaB-like helicase N-terminal domain-containing protein [Candidatus Kaistia colombiensis]|nr:MAG: DnaB-like helicase N-terminal domain-containing protein [Kaistia sp.]
MNGLPQNLEAEQHVIGSILSQNACFDRVSSFLTADDFLEPVHRHLFKVIGDMIGAGQVANPVTMKGAVSDDLQVGELSGMRYVVRLFAEFPMPYAIVDLASAVKDAAVRRGLVLAAERIHEWASLSQPGAKTEELIAECEKQFAEAIGKGRPADEGDAAARAIEEVSLAHQRQKSEAVPWFIGEAQQVLGDDLEFGWLVGLLADSGGGKTSFALQQAYHAMEAGYPVLFLSGDQKPEEVYKQIASQRASVQSNDLRKGRASDNEVGSVITVLNSMRGKPFEVRKMGRPTTAEISMWVRAFNRKHGRGLIIIDHAKRISFTDRRTMLAEGVNQVYGDLKALMQETENAGILLMQRNSDGQGRDNPRPVRGDAYGGAGALENLDGLIALYVEEQWIDHMLSNARTGARKDEIEARREHVKGKAELVGLKARFAEGGVRKIIKREARFTRFASLTDDWREQGSML